MRKLVTLGSTGLAIAAIAAASQTVANADTCGSGGCQTPVSATVTLNTTLQASGFSGTVAFPGAVPGQTVTAPSAEVFTILTNNSSGATVSIKNENGGFRSAPGQADQIHNDALSITTSTGDKQLVADGSTLLENAPAGQHNYSEDWKLAVPASVLYTGSLTASYTISVIANA